MTGFWSLLRKEVTYGEKVPRAYRMAWHEPRRNVAIYCPVPLHWVVRRWRELRSRLGGVPGSPRTDQKKTLEAQPLERERQRLAEEFGRGYLVGWRECFQVCLNAIEDEISRQMAMGDSARWLAGVNETSGPKN